MKTRITAVVIASLLAGSLGSVAYAHGAQQMTPQPQTTPMTSAPNGMSGGQTAQQIKQALTSHGVTATNVTVAFTNGTATLSGTVYSKQDIAKAKKAAMGVPGVNHVDTSGLHARQGQGSQGQGQG